MLYLFNLSLSTSSIAMALLGILISVIGIILLVKVYLKIKRDRKIDVFSMRESFLSFGLLAALSILLIAFSWTSYDEDSITIGDNFIDIEDFEILPPRTVDLPPPLPPVIVEIQNIETIVDQPKLIDESIDVDEVIIHEIKDANFVKLIQPIIKKESEIDILCRIVEDMPRFPGCENAGSKKEKKLCAQGKLLKFIYGNIKYPAIAKENGIEGTAVVQFVVEKNGQVKEVKILKDPGAGCAAEAVRVVELMNKKGLKWTPGRQRGKSVSVRFTLPIKFKLE